MNLYRYYQHDGFRCETIVGIVKAKDMQEAEKIVKNHYEKAYRGELKWSKKEKNKEGAEMLSEGLNYYSKNIIKALTPYATADAGIISMVLRNLADGIEKNNPGAKELRMWAENNTTKPELQETIKVKKPNMR